MKIKNFFFVLFICIFIVSCSSTKNNHSSNSKSSNTTSSHFKLKSRNNSLDDFALALGVSKKELKNKQVYEFIDNWLGVPHKLGGSTKNGIDCSGFVIQFYTEIYNKTLPRVSREMADKIKSKQIDELKEGDLVFFSFSGKNIDHVGVYLHNYKFVHVSTKKGVMISDLNESWYSKYFVKSGYLK